MIRRPSIGLTVLRRQLEIAVVNLLLLFIIMIGSVGGWVRVERRPTTIISLVFGGWMFKLFFNAYELILSNSSTAVWNIDGPINIIGIVGIL